MELEKLRKGNKLIFTGVHGSILPNSVVTVEYVDKEEDIEGPNVKISYKDTMFWVNNKDLKKNLKK